MSLCQTIHPRPLDLIIKEVEGSSYSVFQRAWKSNKQHGSIVQLTILIERKAAPRTSPFLILFVNLLDDALDFQPSLRW